MFIDGLLRASVALFVVVDPFGNIPIFVELTDSLNPDQRKRVFDTGVMSGTILLLLFAFTGHQLLLLFGISLNSFMIAGGILLLLISLQILIQGGEKLLYGSKTNVGVFPIGFPFLAGPGAITTTMIAINAYGPIIAVISIIIVMITTWVIIRSTGVIYKFMGRTGLDIVAKVMAVFLAAIAVEYIIKGTRSVIT